MNRPLRLGTRKSLMATAQSARVARELTERTGQAVDMVGVTTQGDISRAQLARIGGTGVFVTGLRDKLLGGEIDLAVHSLKDLPTAPAEGLVLAAVPRREDPRDALCSAVKLADLPAGATVGTGSPRRVAQLRMLRPDLEYVPIRGNADTRLAKVASGQLTAVVLAYAGLARIGRLDDAVEAFDFDRMLPAPGQGALAVECRADRHDLRELLAVLDDPPTRAAVTAERTVLAVLEAGCTAPVGAYAATDGDTLELTSIVVAADGSAAVRKSTTGPRELPADLGRDLATAMLADGAAELMGERAR